MLSVLQGNQTPTAERYVYDRDHDHSSGNSSLQLQSDPSLPDQPPRASPASG